MIKGTESSGVQNFNPPMGQTAPSEVMIRSTAKPRVYPSAYAHPQAWQDAEDKPTASGESNAQGMSMIKGRHELSSQKGEILVFWLRLTTLVIGYHGRDGLSQNIVTGGENLPRADDISDRPSRA
ncbi:hypothetical protein FXO38_27590 [Capsicum annuum]|nr:hypothetical protein FXO38_27590 [Capsicum annuum]